MRDDIGGDNGDETLVASGGNDELAGDNGRDVLRGGGNDDLPGGTATTGCSAGVAAT